MALWMAQGDDAKISIISLKKIFKHSQVYSQVYRLNIQRFIQTINDNWLLFLIKKCLTFKNPSMIKHSYII